MAVVPPVLSAVEGSICEGTVSVGVGDPDPTSAGATGDAGQAERRRAGSSVARSEAARRRARRARRAPRTGRAKREAQGSHRSACARHSMQRTRSPRSGRA